MGFSACVGTVYDRMYSNKVTHYKPPQDKKEVSAADLLAEIEARKALENPGGAGAGMPAPDAGIPGLGPAPGDPSAPAPMAPPPVPAPPQ